MTFTRPGLWLLLSFLLITFFKFVRTSPEYSWNSDIPCPTLPICNCSKVHNSAYDLECPLVENPSLSLRVYPPAFIYFTCTPSTKASDYDLLKGLQVGSVPAVYFKDHCPLPDVSIEELTQSMGINITYSLQFKSSAIEHKHLKGLKVKNLILSFNRITEVPEDLFQDLINLESFDLAGNRLRYLPTKIFKNLRKLKFIELSNNHLLRLDDGIFENLTEIYEINIRRNELSSLGRDLFAGLTSLNKLDVSHNNLTELPIDIFRDLKNLRELEMDGNNFTKLPETLLWPVEKLKEFSMEESKQEPVLPDYFFSKLTELKKIDLKRNQFSSIPEKVFWNCSSITNIDILQNSLKAIPRDLFRDLVNLEFLNLGFNQLEQLPDDGFRNLGKLSYLRLDSNRLETISENVFRGLKSLKTLDLKHNRLSYLHEQSFAPLQKLETLELSDNFLSFKNEGTPKLRPQSPFRYCTNLKKLYLDQNLIREVFIDWRLNLTKLRSLDLSYNKLQHLSADDIYFLSKDVTVYLQYNNISVFDFKNVEGLATGLWLTYPPRSHKGQIEVYVEGNPLICDCRAYDFIRYLDVKNWPAVNFKASFEPEELKCELPEVLKGVLAKNVKLEDLIFSEETKMTVQAE